MILSLEQNENTWYLPIIFADRQVLPSFGWSHVFRSSSHSVPLLQLITVTTPFKQFKYLSHCCKCAVKKCPCPSSEQIVSGHFFISQDLLTVCVGSPSQSFPPYWGTGLVQVRSCDRVCKPSPHVTEQLLHSVNGPYSDQPPSTEIKMHMYPMQFSHNKVFSNRSWSIKCCMNYLTFHDKISTMYTFSTGAGVLIILTFYN